MSIQAQDGLDKEGEGFSGEGATSETRDTWKELAVDAGVTYEGEGSLDDAKMRVYGSMLSVRAMAEVMALDIGAVDEGVLAAEWVEQIDTLHREYINM
jgi:hypothetical protein